MKTLILALFALTPHAQIANDAVTRRRVANDAVTPRVGAIVVVNHRATNDLYRAIVDFARALPDATTHWWQDGRAAPMVARLRRAGVRIVARQLDVPVPQERNKVWPWYNRLFARDVLWRGLPGTHVLIVQADAGTCGGAQGFDPGWLRYDFVGGENLHGRYNGGVSLRSLRAQRSANRRPQRKGMNEDSRLYTFCARAPGCHLAPREAAGAFALTQPGICHFGGAIPWAYHQATRDRRGGEWLRAACPNAAWRFNASSAWPAAASVTYPAGGVKHIPSTGPLRMTPVVQSNRRETKLCVNSYPLYLEVLVLAHDVVGVQQAGHGHLLRRERLGLLRRLGLLLLTIKLLVRAVVGELLQGHEEVPQVRLEGREVHP
jgi:hypothetical protein